MDSVEVSTVVYLPPAEVYEFVEDFPRYANYSKYLRHVRQHGDGGPGTNYDLHFKWWKLTYTARSEVTAVDPPNSLDWHIVKDIDAHGVWEIEPAPEAAPPEVETASRVTLSIDFDPDSARSGAVDLPRFVSMGWVIEKVKPKIRKEAERIVERIVADLEGQSREVELTIHDRPSEV